jgi:OHCU decarboxylase
MDREAFVARYGLLFESSPWVAAAAWEHGPFTGTEELYEALRQELFAAPPDRQLALIRAHPDLGEKAAMTGESRREQASAGLDRLSRDEYETFTRLNAAYRERFGFPFVVCVRDHTKESILRTAGQRLAHDRDDEVKIALEEIASIARHRLEELG